MIVVALTLTVVFVTRGGSEFMTRSLGRILALLAAAGAVDLIIDGVFDI